VFSYNKINYKRNFEFELRQYISLNEKLSEDDEGSTTDAGPYVADMRLDSEPFGFRVSHVSIKSLKKLRQLIIYLVND
jgi:hypothetical protein